jgi:hypothetical protein
MPPVPWVSVNAAAAPYVHLAELADQVNDPRLSPVPSLSVVAAAPPAESFPFKPVAQEDKPAPSFAPSAASVDLAAVSVAGSLSAQSLDAAGYVDATAMSTVHCHFQQSPAAVAAGSTHDHAPAEDSPYENTALLASYVPSATDAQCFGALSSFLGGDC